MIPQWVVEVSKFKAFVINLVQCRCGLPGYSICTETFSGDKYHIVPLEHAGVFVRVSWLYPREICRQAFKLLVICLIVQTLEIYAFIDLRNIYRLVGLGWSCRLIWAAGLRSWWKICLVRRCGIDIWCGSLCIWLIISNICKLKCLALAALSHHGHTVSSRGDHDSKLVHGQFKYIASVEQRIWSVGRSPVHCQNTDGKYPCSCGDTQLHQHCPEHTRLLPDAASAKWKPEPVHDDKTYKWQQEQHYDIPVGSQCWKKHSPEVHSILGTADGHQTQKCSEYLIVYKLCNIVDRKYTPQQVGYGCICISVPEGGQCWQGKSACQRKCQGM